MSDFVAKLGLAKSLTAADFYADGNEKFLKFIRDPKHELSMDDREFVAMVIEFLYWRAFESKRTKKPSKTPTYRNPGPRKDQRLFVAVLNLMFVAGFNVSEENSKQRRELFCEMTGLSWNQARGRINRLDEPLRTAARSLFELQGRTEPQ